MAHFVATAKEVPPVFELVSLDLKANAFPIELAGPGFSSKLYFYKKLPNR